MTLKNILIAGAAVIAIAAPATAQTFDWSFDNSRHGDPDTFVTGTIGNLHEGVNDLSLNVVTLVITSTPTGQGLGTYDYSSVSGFIDVTDGEITYAHAFFGMPMGIGYFALSAQPGDEYPEYLQSGGNYIDGYYTLWDFSSDNPATFSRAAEAPAAAPEPASWALMVGGFGLAGAAMRRRRSATVRFA